MNITNAAYFTFNVDNTMFLTGLTGSGKSVLQDKLIEGLIKGHTPESLQFVLLDMTSVDFEELREKHKEFIQKYVAVDSEEGIRVLEEMALLSQARIDESVTKPMIFICIEECDMAFIEPPRFENALMKINANAKQANMKLVFSTSRPAPDVISKQLLCSFDLIVAGQLASDADHEYLGVPKSQNVEPYSFTIIDISQDNVS
jgi:DNA segregation ATPase FtsK/SpoIIIE-like protein